MCKRNKGYCLFLLPIIWKPIKVIIGLVKVNFKVDLRFLKVAKGGYYYKDGFRLFEGIKGC
jgi:hypothetical protein